MDLNDLRDELVNPRCGIIAELFSEAAPNGVENLFIFRGELSRPLNYAGEVCSEGHLDQILVSGVGTDVSSALRSALGEGVERYATLTFQQDRTIWASYSELASEALNPADFVGYTEAQFDSPGFPFQRFDTNEPCRWACGIDLATREMVFVPAKLIWLGVPLLKSERKFSQPVSSGTAAGTSLAHANLAAILELLERDALMSRWLLMASPAIVPEDIAVEPPVGELWASLRTLGARIDFFDLAVEAFCPVVAARLCWPDVFPGFVLGASAAASTEVAMRKALCEALHIYNNARLVGDVANCGIKINDPSDVRDFSDHGHFYRRHKSGVGQSFFHGEGVVADSSSLPSTTFEHGLDELLGRLSAAGLRVISIDITPPEIAVLGVSVVRCVVPGLQPITAGTGMECRETRRLESVARKLALPFPSDLNLLPHPLS
ncbi:YcaO-like family protein [Rhizobium leguminosarum]|uniref:YcaO-like family protein n=1 Tax=Rhizobium leguminosarum TaxID=384 RepID=UPI00047FC116|nr:YcaO-like family protein [Rhizobium leguminosarum]